MESFITDTHNRAHSSLFHVAVFVLVNEGHLYEFHEPSMPFIIITIYWLDTHNNYSFKISNEQDCKNHYMEGG